MRLYFFLHSPAVSFVHKRYTCDSFSNGCSVLNLIYCVCLRQHISWFTNVAKHYVGLCPPVNIGKTNDMWLALKPLGNNRPHRRSKNIFRGIMMGIGPIWGINSLSPFILSWFDIMMFSPLAEGGGGGGTQQIFIFTGRLCPEVQPLTLLYSIFHEKRYPFHIPSIDKWYPFHIPSMSTTLHPF